MAAGCDANCATVHTSEIFPTAQVTSFRHRVRGYERVLVATALLVTFGITGFAAASRGEDANTASPSPLRGRNPDLAQYSDTPSLRVTGFEYEEEDESPLSDSPRRSD